MNKKGLLELDRVASYILYGLVLFFIILVLNIGGCSPDKVKQGITSDDRGFAALRASEQLSAYLRTEMPDFGTLKASINSLIGKGSIEFSLEGGKLKTDKVIEFLEKHPEVYVGKTYGGFISALYAYKDESLVDEVFDTTTKALFHMHTYPKSVRDVNEGRLDDIYFTPTISVKYGSYATFIYERGDLMSSDALAVSFTSLQPGVFKNLPTYDKTGATVKLQMPKGEGTEEDVSLPLP
jgi:hypothetical protein